METEFPLLNVKAFHEELDTGFRKSEISQGMDTHAFINDLSSCERLRTSFDSDTPVFIIGFTEHL
jgi:hypothetical protein